MNAQDIERLVVSACGPLVATGSRAWISTAEPLHVMAEDAWLRVSGNGAWSAASEPTDAFALLCRQGMFDGSVKLLRPFPPSTWCADVPLLRTSAGRDWSARQLRRTVGSMRGASAAPSPGCGPAADSSFDPEAAALACADAGWRPVIGADRSVRLSLPVRGVQRTLVIRPAGPSSIRACVALESGLIEDASAACRLAAAELLLRASMALRWARAAVWLDTQSGAPDAAGFELEMVNPPDPSALQIAVDCLFAACERFGREAEVLLGHPAIAQAYLAQCGLHVTEPRPNPPVSGTACSAGFRSLAADAAFA